jgi:protein RecA
MERRAPIASLSKQVKEHVKKPIQKRAETVGSEQVISTGSTLLDLSISGGRFPKGGIPGGILVEIFGPSSSGKTVLLCEIAGAIQRQGGAVMFRDPEARLNKQFAEMFGFKVSNADYDTPDTVKELFEPIRKWDPEGIDIVHGFFADSLAALSTEMELSDKDQYGMRRAKEFSEECRKVARILAQRNILMVCSNQVRQNIDAGPFAEKYSSPGGMAIGFYSSLRLRCHSPMRIKSEKVIGKDKVTRVAGVKTQIEVYKSSVWEPFRSTPVNILYTYGIDDIRGNLEFVKGINGESTYTFNGHRLGLGLEKAIKTVEQDGLDSELKQHTIDLWREVEEKFKVSRVAKRRN